MYILGCFHVLVIVNNAAVNIEESMCLFRLEVSPDICPGVGLLDHIVTLVFFKEPLYCFP